MKILILGLGRYPKGSGISAALWYARQKDMQVRVTDMRSKEDLAANVKRLKTFKNVDFVLGKHRKSDIKWADVIVRNPGVRNDSDLLVYARKLGKQIVNDISIFMAQCPAKVVGITGTRGKSTTSTLAAEMLTASGKKTWLGGNITVSPLTFLKKIKKDDVVVLELSSWLVETLGERGISPHIACITNIMRDHLNAYENMDAYVEAKAQIFRHQSPSDVLILNADDPYTSQFKKEAPSMVKAFSATKKSDASGLIAKKDLKIAGEHNYRNALAAALVAKEAGATKSGIKKALKSFKGLENRQEIIREAKGIRYVNDTTATTPDATKAAIEAFWKKGTTIHLLFGGADKELEFDDFAKLLKRKQVCVTVFDGTAFAKIEKSFKKAKLPFQLVNSMKEAMAYHRDHAEKGDTILLSPGCASFGLFKNEFDRGDQFKKEAHR